MEAASFRPLGPAPRTPEGPYPERTLKTSIPFRSASFIDGLILMPGECVQMLANCRGTGIQVYVRSSDKDDKLWSFEPQTTSQSKLFNILEITEIRYHEMRLVDINMIK